MRKRPGPTQEQRWAVMASVLVFALAAVMSWNSAVADEPHETGSHDHAQGIGSSGSAIDQATLEHEKAYSLLMHRSSGLALLAVGGLLLADRLTRRRYRVVRIARGIAWMLLGVHILLNADPAHWPMGAGFVESFSIPSPNEWLQHKILALLPLGLGLYTIVTRAREPTPLRCYATAGLLALGAIGLWFHEHLHEPGMNMALIERQHQWMAVTSLLIASASAAEGWEPFRWSAKLFLLPTGLILLGLILATYIE